MIGAEGAAYESMLAFTLYLTATVLSTFLFVTFVYFSRSRLRTDGPNRYEVTATYSLMFISLTLSCNCLIWELSIFLGLWRV